ncbi:MAG: transcription termination factor Rho [Candidatus Blackburnbacteria bacterium RIFCSPHIGHO2_02_FULL_39_13]|uniref:Transcription termination factor Rho n=1 Tax=Candidatus Blackburnbacteria bacterium RIFCSPLOWO2_01_FULL_40_20 TaxID=1797519 RepID=A0A1G1VFY8_9BACT|nr:MAG: transcription termination factor Rho [Candidatus Blackburnbacteria bacterium RIFCSPHIGHO2_01_FULL_40_17]OGY08822.1 MAG: transcription termination factor Rho [Candidatus Blackburnbacteria bacterium RIFCSPHIGHO2_02_FULL_39_13]OGY14196.1 MAG: transcription termination factor Rho [Candidatus Blackburnbacteria bacterium RIFCSPLOWO2_01_FULL_40_20]HBL51689.1 transcription termination factor Rho [Candidatus Blackburnbacteria bacterium]
MDSQDNTKPVKDALAEGQNNSSQEDSFSEQGSGYDSSFQRRPYRQYDERSIPDAGLPTEYLEGVLDIAEEGSGLLRPFTSNLEARSVYISSSQIRRFNLRAGDLIGGQARSPKENERFWGLLKVEKVNGDPVDQQTDRPRFEDLKPIHPQEQIKLETDPEKLTTRVIDLVAPVGFGQRGLIVSPPKAGKTIMLKDIASGIALNYPEGEKGGVHLMAVLIGERPEEVTDIEMHIDEVTGGKGEVAASNFDEAPDDQTRVAELALERAKRLVERGMRVVVLLDSITRLARAYNLALPTSGRTLTGGFDPVALYPAKKFFGAARNFAPMNIGVPTVARAKGDIGPSLTIIGTALVDTGSRMDDLIYEEFKGTGNMELHLDRRLADRRVYPAIDVTRSGTRQEEILYGPEIMPLVVTLRRMFDLIPDGERTETFLERLRKTKSNKDFFQTLAKG